MLTYVADAHNAIRASVTLKLQRINDIDIMNIL